MNIQFKRKFVKYLTEGIAVHIPEDEIPLFYRSLSDYINATDNEFMSFNTILDEGVMISDKDCDVLRVLYRLGKIEFLKPDPDAHEHMISYNASIRMGQAFLGVILFIENMSPTEDSNLIPSVYHDQWQIRQ